MTAHSNPDVVGVHPLSPAQAGMLFHRLRDERSDVYLEQDRYRLTGPLDSAAFRAAWQAVADRHEALRTAVLWEGLEQPLAVVRARITVPWGEVDLAGLPEVEQRRRIEELLDAHRRSGIDLATEPPLSLLLVRLGDEVHELLWTSQHIVLDGWSAAVVLREVFALYRAALEGRTAELPEPVPHARYLAWLRSRDEAAQERFWRVRMTGFEAPTALRVPTPAPTAPVEPSIRIPFALDAESTLRLKEMTRRHRITVTTVVEAAWALTLSAFSGERDVVFGAVRSGRLLDLPEADAVVGMLVNTLPVRVTADPAAPVSAWLTALHHTLTEQRGHEHASLADIQAWSTVPRPNSLFDSLVTVQALPMLDAAELPVGLRCEPVEARVDSGYATALVVTPGEVLAGELVCRPESVDVESAAALAATVTRLLHGIAARPEALVGTLELVDAADRARLAEAFTPGADEPGDKSGSVLELIADQVRTRPDTPAVLWGEGGRLDYRALDALADAWAAELAARGVGPEVPVGICFGRCPELVVAMLAVLRAGGCYVPIDPEHPRRRRADTLAGTGVRLLLTSQALASRFEGEDGPDLLAVTLDPPAAGGATPQARPTDPDALAYVVYTSGSTGTPKGVGIPHRALDWFVATAGYAGVGPGDVVGMASSPSFDALTFEVWTALTHGATLRVVPHDLLFDPAVLSERLAIWGVDVMYMTAALVEELARHAPGFATGLKVLLFGGQAADPAAVARVSAASASCTLLQVYGPTETTVWSSVEQVAAGTPGFVPLGRPIARTTEYLLDADLRPVPPGMPGELYIGGDGVARGYHARPALTAERFLPDPFTQGRMYRTGDLARLRPDGRLEFLRRADEQIKIRGFRVEPGEIATVLREHPDVDAAAVAVRQDAQRGAILVGYVVPAVGARADEAAWRQFAASRLPAYMLPTTYVVLDALPLSVTGKVDRGRLPAPAAHSAPETTADAPPASALEHSIAELWARVLGLPEVGVDEDFFQLGGHSLVAVRVIASLARELRLSAKVRDLFDAPTVRRFAAVARPVEVDAEQRIPTAPAGPVPLSSGQRRMWMLPQVTPGSAEYNSPTLLRLRGPLETRALEAALADVVERHAALRVRITMTEDGPVQQADSVPPLPLVLHDLTGLPAGEREEAAHALVLTEAATGFDLERGPFLRCVCVRLADAEHLLLLTVHHIAFDAVSERIIAADLADRYGRQLTGTADPVEPPAVSYLDYAAWEHGRRAAGYHAGEETYWARALHDLPLAELPTDRARPPVRSGAGATHEFTVPLAQAEALASLGAAHGATAFMAFLAVFGVLVGRHCGQEQVAIGSPTDLRGHPDLANVVGFMVNTLVLHVDLTGDPTFEEVLRRVRDVTLDAHAHRHAPFDAVVEAVNPERDTGRTPLFDVLFQLSPEPALDWSLPGLDVTSIQLPRRASNFDLDFEMAAGPDGGLAGRVLYNTELFDPATIRLLTDRFVALVERICAQPRTPVAALDLLHDADRAVLAALTSGEPVAGTGPGKRLDAVVAAHARRAPESQAVVYGGAAFGYQELDRRADRLAASLRERGVGRGDVVGLWAERRPETVVGILAVLRAGAAYLPLEPTDPAERIAFLLRDRGCAAVLTRGRADHLPEEFRGAALDLEPAEGASAMRPAPVGTSPSDLAYVIYTSGSTGQPKAVGIEHASVSHYARAAAGAYLLNDRDRVLQMSSLGFDAFVSELWTTLTAGAALVLPEDPRMSPGEFLAQVASTGTTVVDLPTAFWHMLCAWLANEAQPAVVPASLRLVIIGGEQANAGHLAQWRAAVPPGVRLINSYGPTEATCVVTHADLSGPEPGDAHTRAVPIGRPLPGTRAYVLDARLRPVPPGVTGSLYVAGPQVARGYLDAPAATATSFLPDPWGPPGARMYGTGDAVRLAGDGRLQMLGRADNQVKVRGYRVELGEVEGALAAFPGVGAAAAAVREHPQSGPLLVGYVVPAGADGPDPAEVRTFLRERLPRHAVPDLVMVLDRLPLSRTGKVDRRTLPLPGATPEQPVDTSAALTEAEQALAEIWLSVLPVDRVSPGDRFFDLGGHSLALARVGARIRNDLQLDIPLIALYERPTLAEQAAVIEALIEAEIAEMSGAEIRDALASPPVDPAPQGEPSSR
ncbi:amino acid adenylation domain-containing protein [Streptomyces goshikiensis]|uniref:amino acid adenylation domain-containing protein n=1 Tax=Streptomyces goshikiensis TaxID=1942 RepID=UPI0036B695C5